MRTTGPIWMVVALLGGARGAASRDGAVANTSRVSAAIVPSVASQPPPVGVSEAALCESMADAFAEFAVQPDGHDRGLAPTVELAPAFAPAGA
jgi:hypothetical protein